MFWLGVIVLMIAYDLLKVFIRKWRSLERENMVNARKAINGQCAALVKELHKRKNN